MKNVFIIVVSFWCFLDAADAQSPNWEWAIGAGGSNGNVVGAGISTDANGNIYTTGSFESPAISFGNYTLTNNSSVYGSNIFLVKYDASGNSVWAKNAGGKRNDVSQAASSDANGNIYITGYFQSSAIAFDSTVLTNADTSTNIGSVLYNSAVFLAKYDSTGNVLWAKQAGGTAYDAGNSLSTDASGNIYVAGVFFSPSITFGSITLTKTTPGDSAFCAGFLVKYDASGNVIWAKSMGGSGYDVYTGVSADAMGNVYVTGNFSSASVVLGSTTLTTNGEDDILVAKYDSLGHVLWAKGEGEINYWSEGNDIDADVFGNVYVTGMFSGSTITFDSTTLINSSSGGNGFFIAKYDSVGNIIWAKSVDGSASGQKVSTDIFGSAYVTGLFSETTIFGSETLYNNSPGGINFFIAKYNASGNVVWARDAADDDNDNVRGITDDTFGNIYLTGGFNGTKIVFDGDSLVNTNSNTAFYDFFIAKLDTNHVTGVENISAEENISIYPNPLLTGTWQLIVDYNLLGSQAAILDATGKIVYQTQIKNLHSEIPAQLPGGVYLLRITSGATVVTRKLVKL